MMENIWLEEKQYFRQSWLWWLIGISTVVIVTGIIIAGQREQQEEKAFVAAGVFLTIMLPVFLLLFILNLRTVYSSSGIRYRFRPFHLKEHIISWKEVESAAIRKYQPIAEYGGWGLRMGLKAGKAYNVSGNLGLQLKMVNGKKILFGTNRAEELEKILRENGIIRD